jgi:hypothetical protein
LRDNGHVHLGHLLDGRHLACNPRREAGSLCAGVSERRGPRQATREQRIRRRTAMRLALGSPPWALGL